MNVLICPDKFKGTLDASRAARAIAQGWRKVRPNDLVEELPISDGGDGFGSLLGRLLSLDPRCTRAVDAAHRPCWTRWWRQRSGGMAVVESARTVGLAMLPPGKYHPFELDTFGLGAVVEAAETQGTTELLLGIGGSATNDGGFGLARAAGWGFFDRRGKAIERWTDLQRLVRLQRPRRLIGCAKILVAVDVTNPLLGPAGASRVYGPQKGLRSEDFPKAERCLRRLAEVTRSALGRDFAETPGAGAAGGLGFGLQAFMLAKLKPGFDLFARYAGLAERFGKADLVITGEGSIDRSTLMGKGVGLVAARCKKLRVPCLGVAGVIGDDVRSDGSFTSLHGLTEVTAASDAMARPAYWLKAVAKNLAASW